MIARFGFVCALLAGAWFLLGAVIPSQPGGTVGPAYWDDPDTWDGPIPGAVDEALIQSEVVIRDDRTVGAVRIVEGGSLRFEGTATLTVDASAGGDATGRVDVQHGRLTMRPEVGERQTLEWVGLDEALMVGGDAGMMTDPGGLHVHGAGVLDLDGPDRTSWTRATGALTAGQTVIEVQDATGWQVGDELAITPTVPVDRAATTDAGMRAHVLAYSYASIAGINGNVVTLGAALQHDHPATTGLTAEVLNLTRDVLIRTASGGRSYVMWHPSAASAPVVRDAAFVGLGPAGVPGRYPLHLHRMRDASRGAQFTRNLVLDTETHGIVPHESNGVTLDSNVVHDFAEDAYWWDQTDETGLYGFTNPNQCRDQPGFPCGSDDNVWANNLASLADFDGPGYKIAGFNLGAGVGNIATGNVAAGIAGAKDCSGFEWPEVANRRDNVWTFTGGVTHNSECDGIFVWQNDKNDHVVDGFTAYAISEAGVDHGAYGNDYTYRNLTLVDVEHGVKIHADGAEQPIRFENLTVEGVYAVGLPRHQNSIDHPPEIVGLAVNVDTVVGVFDAANNGQNPSALTITGLTGTWGGLVEWSDALTGGTVTIDGATYGAP